MSIQYTFDTSDQIATLCEALEIAWQAFKEKAAIMREPVGSTPRNTIAGQDLLNFYEQIARTFDRKAADCEAMTAVLLKVSVDCD
jgi:hypothetical protein